VLTPHPLVAGEVAEQRNGLNRFPEESSAPTTSVFRHATYPRPISSAKIPFMLLAYKLASHSSPAC
jgi:hypothetical protein